MSVGVATEQVSQFQAVIVTGVVLAGTPCVLQRKLSSPPTESSSPADWACIRKKSSTSYTLFHSSLLTLWLSLSVSLANINVTSPGRVGISSQGAAWFELSTLIYLWFSVSCSVVSNCLCPMDCSRQTPLSMDSPCNILEWVSFPSPDLPDLGSNLGLLDCRHSPSEPGKLCNLSGPHHSHPQNCH